LVGAIIVDEDGIYDPRHPNDRLELSLFRKRSQEALKQKARRGALFLRVAAGYVKVGRDRIEKDPDQRVQGALKLLFAKFAEFHSARAFGRTTRYAAGARFVIGLIENRKRLQQWVRQQ
jgi:DNA invertase Pin-like site-specific DNA recombinase